MPATFEDVRAHLDALKAGTRRPRHPGYVKDVAEKIGIQVWPEFIERACDTRAEVYLNGGWRGTKTHSADFSAFLYIFDLVMLYEGEHLVWIIGPDYPQARPDFFNLVEWCRPMGFAVTATDRQDGSLRATVSMKNFPGTVVIETKSGSNPQTLGAVGPKVILACEAGQMTAETRDRIRGRSSTYNAPIIWSGTFENEDGKPVFAWFEKESLEYLRNPTPRRKAYSLPSYGNLALFGSCLEGFGSVALDPTLAAFCPDDDHGDGHRGVDPDHPQKIVGTSGVPRHPKLRELYEDCRTRPLYWKKFYQGEPVGITNPIYEWASSAPQDFLRPLPKDVRWLKKTGGMDFGLGGINHPSAVVLISMDFDGNVWVRFAEEDGSGYGDWAWDMKKALDRQFYPVESWGHDTSLRYPPDQLGTNVMSGTMNARFARVGVMNTYAMSRRLFFDSDNPGVVRCFEQLQRIHFEESRNGKVDYARTDDDMVAALECAIAEIHAPHASLPQSIAKRSKPVTRTTNRYVERRAVIGKRRGL